MANIQNAEVFEPASPVPITKGVPSSSDASLNRPDLMALYSRFAPTQRIVIITVASTISLLSPLSSNLYTPAIPAVARDLNVSTDAINLTITSYLMLQGISPTLWSAIGDSTRRHLLYLIALTVYFASCIGLALSHNYPAVIALRAVQAVGSASTTAISASLISNLIHVSRRGKYMGNYSALGGAGTAFSPLDTPKSGNGAADAKAGAKFRVNIGAPVRLLVKPKCLCIVIFTGICYSVWQVTMVATATLYAERYGLNEISIRLTYISNGVGSLCCSVLTGKLLDREYKRQLKREQEAQQSATDGADSSPPVQEVEHIELARIKPVIIPTVAYLLSVVALGWIIKFHVHIAASITMAFFIGGLDTIILAAFSTLIVDLFRSQSFSATASINLSRCLLASGGTAAISPLIRAVGVGWAFTICAIVALISCSLALLELCRGRHWRARRMREASQRKKAA
ncbi:major facilitator superfamily transporter [Colletotrichum zoysiae]|uniref:Major facilitator superfamily transporter n=1 Tax=Colletotrichum zoysiae TaxID=1216348 RepID=A0AAD9HHT8_9PEZI|nr:major facilitator superfamily transporter [Colletotrichum zoysiae]